MNNTVTVCKNLGGYTVAVDLLQQRQAEKEALSSLPQGTILLLATDAACPTGWVERADIIAILDAKTSDDFSSQDFNYIKRGEGEDVVRMQSCLRVN
ncbi:hypothetical protein OIU34_37855 [Pararhizobium sp. BT-229]|uniref:hypothetical protein n=1 Tax=Pararhizobium sp. BT-229 TaxID=2986923 RepID=UPI0021F6B33D|nr:hypothetical protein [Pararhizobium sp. BT-229]MCV9967594.1 hypothetical protein [Pararhizobium sp. BT-229]